MSETKALIIRPSSKSDLAVAKYESREHRRQLAYEAVKGIVSHPVTLMIGGCALVEWLQHNIVLDRIPSTPGSWNWDLPDFGWHFGRPAEEQKLFSQTLATMVEAGILMWGTHTSVKDLSEVVRTLTEAIGKTIPMVIPK